MKELFKNLFQTYNLTDEEAETMGREFTSVVLLSLVGATKNKLSGEEEETLRSYFKEKNVEKMVALIKSKYEEKEWKTMVQQHVEPLIQDYVKTVLAA